MRLGTKILLLTLAITVGTSLAVSWLVTWNVTSYETARADADVSAAISQYLRHLDERQQQISRVVRAMMEAPAQRSLLQDADESANPASREQLRQEVLGRDVQTELQTRDGGPAFQLLLNLAGEVVVATTADPRFQSIPFDQIHWRIDTLLQPGDRHLPMQYVATDAGLFITMAAPLRTQLSEAPSIAYIVGFRVDDVWAKSQLVAGNMTGQSSAAPLTAWFVVDGHVVAKASSAAADPRVNAFHPELLAGLGPATTTAKSETDGVQHVQFSVAGERYLGQTFQLDPSRPEIGRLVLASSLDQALLPLRRLQRMILWTALAACAVAVVACRLLASLIAHPIGELVAGTQRIAAGHFDQPITIRRRDEIGVLAGSFNQMAEGLKERDVLREEKVRIERDLAVARKIQMDILPKELPPCPGYDTAAFAQPADATGGDIYDLVATTVDPKTPGELPSVVLLLADATGHGIGPAISVTQVRSMLRIGMRLKAHLDDVFAQINRQLCHDLDSGRFVTAFLGMLEPTLHRITYHSAGQAPLLHFHAADGRFEWLDSSMLPLGIYEDAMSDGSRTMHLAAGDLVVLLTDGFYECSNGNKEQFGEARVSEIIRAHHHLGAKALLNALLEATKSFTGGSPQMDDMTGVIIRRIPVGAAEARGGRDDGVGNPSGNPKSETRIHESNPNDK